MKTALLSLPRAALAWLRAGYPAGIPKQDYVSIYGVLHRRLTPVEVAEVAEIVGPSNGEGERIRHDVAAEITRTAKESAGADDIDRVCARLAANYGRAAQPDQRGQPPS